MEQVKTISRASLLLTGLLLSSQAQAIPSFGTTLDSMYGKTLSGGSCSVCHENTNDDPNWFSQYGTILILNNADDDDPIGPIITRIENTDFDDDGFTIKQEIYGGSFNGGSLDGTPALLGGTLYDNSVYAKAGTDETISSLTVSNTTTEVTAATAAGFANKGGVIDFTITNVNATATLELMFKTGAIHLDPDHEVFFVDDNNAVSTLTAVADTVDDGNITVSIVDDGPNDLMTAANLQAAAVTQAQTFTFTPTDIFDGYSGVSPHANISPLALVDQNATIDAYAVVDDYANIGAVTIGSYAYIGKNAVVTNIVDPYASVADSAKTSAQVSLATTVGVVQSRIAVTTKTPVSNYIAPVGGSGGSDGGGTGTDPNAAGGLHCMTSGLGTQGLMFFGLLVTGFLVRRKNR